MGALEMGCPDRCIGYELAANLDFDTDGSGTTSEAGDTYWNDGAGWEPIGSEDNPYIANFWGESHTLANLFINRPTEDGIGLFGELGYAGTNGHISDVGLVEVDVTGRDRVGALFGRSMYMTVFKSYATGRVTGRGNKVGGLAGESWGNLIDTYAAVEVSGPNLDQPPPGEPRGTGGLVGLNLGVINSSYATGDVTGYPAGGLVGWNSGGFISTSYATGAVTGTTVGGLVGRNDGPGRISISYATGRVSGNRDVGGLIGTNASIIAGNYSTGPVSATSSTDSSVGGLVGANESAFGRITESYWDSTTSGIAGARGLSTAALQGPTGLDGIYQHWSGRWHFGTSLAVPGPVRRLRRRRRRRRDLAGVWPSAPCWSGVDGDGRHRTGGSGLAPRRRRPLDPGAGHHLHPLPRRHCRRREPEYAELPGLRSDRWHVHLSGSGRGRRRRSDPQCAGDSHRDRDYSE